jgi:cell division protein FtsZ
VIDEGMGDEIRVTLIATGFDKPSEPYASFQRTERPRGAVDRGPRIDERQRSSLEIRDDEIDIPPFLR